MDISARELISQLRTAIASFPDARTGQNTLYGMADIALAAFSTFFMQCPSFLSYQHQMEKISGKNNARSLFTVSTIPSDTQIRKILDNVPPQRVFSVFSWCLNWLINTGRINEFKSELGFLVAFDGTQYFSSDTIHCEDCLTKTDKKTGKITYYHTVVTPVMVKPGSEYVLPLIPEFILPQDMESLTATEEKKKQDCEINASKRLLRSQEDQALKDLEIVYLGDDLYAHEPFCRKVLGTGRSFIFVCKPESHKTVYEWIKGITKEYVEDRYDGKKHRIYTYSYCEGVPINNTKNSLLVNFIEVTVRDRVTGKQTYHNAFITNLPLELETADATKSNLAAIVDCGRARWKIENENNNTLKTKGYYFEHNYGHGEKYLSFLLTTLILIAFLFHTLLDMFCEPYKEIRQELVTRMEFFGAIRFLTRFYYTTGWDHLFWFMKTGLETLFPMPRDKLTAILLEKG